MLSTSMPAMAAPPMARNTVAKLPERRKAMMRNVAKNTSAAPISPMRARPPTQMAEKPMK